MATLSFEIELDLAGHVTPYRAATWMQPAEGGEVEVLAISDAGVLEANCALPAQHPRRWVRKSFLTGVDLKNPQVQLLLANLLELVRADAEMAVSDDAVDAEDALADRLWEDRREASL